MKKTQFLLTRMSLSLLGSAAEKALSEDKILLKGSVFTGLAAGTLSARAFTVGAEATSKEHRIVYNEATGEVSYDVDGSGARAAIKFAVLTPGATLWADHFLVG